MNFFIGIAVVITAITVALIIKEPRRFRNGVFILFNLGFWALTYCAYICENPTHRNILILNILILMIPLLYLFIMIYLLVCGVKNIKREGFSLSHSLSLGLSLLMMFAPIWGLLVIFIVGVLLKSAGLAFCLMTLFMFFMVTFGAFFLYSVVYCIMPRNIECNYVVIHGAGLTSDGQATPLLKKRIDKAIEIYKKCKVPPKFVPSGGQGSDEKITEAQAIKNYLIDKGISEEFIIMEDKSTTTYENLKYTKKLLDSIEGNQPYKCILVTNNYHALRTGIYARGLKMKAQAVGCSTAAYFLPDAFLREYFAVMKMNKMSLILLAVILGLELIAI